MPSSTSTKQARASPLKNGVHQTDARLGADCVALVTYAQRRLGHTELPYTAPSAVKNLLEPVAEGELQRGDVLHFGFQTAMLAEDTEPFGQLNASDVVIHTYHGLAELRTFGTLPYRDAGLDIMRWP